MENPTYIHLERIDLGTGMAAILGDINEPVKARRVQVGSHEVHVTSLRLRVFLLKGTKCYICGTQATHFSIDKFRLKSQNEAPHMNMWGVNPDGTDLLFTHDHVLARGHGGKDKIENAETCCTTCNGHKAFVENMIKARRCQPPAYIIAENGDMFEGHQGQWADCFFTNATRAAIEDYLKDEKVEYVIRDMTPEELVRMPEAIIFHKWLLERYGTA